jgi:hypothetical protein
VPDSGILLSRPPARQQGFTLGVAPDSPHALGVSYEACELIWRIAARVVGVVCGHRDRLCRWLAKGEGMQPRGPLRNCAKTWLIVELRVREKAEDFRI